LIDGGLGGFEFAAVEGEEVVGAEVGFGHLGEEFLLIGEAVVVDALAGDEQGGAG
jgi:hypothetical protein